MLKSKQVGMARMSSSLQVLIKAKSNWSQQTRFILWTQNVLFSAQCLHKAGHVHRKLGSVHTAKRISYLF